MSPSRNRWIVSTKMIFVKMNENGAKSDGAYYNGVHAFQDMITVTCMDYHFSWLGYSLDCSGLASDAILYATGPLMTLMTLMAEILKIIRTSAMRHAITFTEK